MDSGYNISLQNEMYPFDPEVLIITNVNNNPETACNIIMKNLQGAIGVEYIGYGGEHDYSFIFFNLTCSYNQPEGIYSVRIP